MIRFEEALKIVLSEVEAKKMTVEPVRLSSVLGRILGQDVFADMDMPPFDKSAVDGFACRMADISRPLRVIETIPAGKTPEYPVLPGECARIMTGAIVPAGADCVVMIEHTEPAGDNTLRVKHTGKASNICLKGEDIRKGDLVLEKGTRITPAHVAVLAAMGVVNPKMSRLPRVGIISTGNELVEPWADPGIAQIRNSNASQLEAQVKTVPAVPSYYGIVPDEGPGLLNAISIALAENDILLLTGGVSMGDFDLVPQILEEAGVEILFRKIAVQPGKPTVFGRRDRSVVFGLPGNPVSSFVIFEMVVRPFILLLEGCNSLPAAITLPLGCDFHRRNTERLGLVPVILKDGAAYPLEYHGSAHINAYSAASGIMSVNPGLSGVNKGEQVNVRLL